jgi:ABC-type multidrug transport system ATPase subunit
MLCGLYAPSSGTAFILDKDIRTQMEEIRTSLGFCPQHSIVFDELTVRQHLDLVGSIKGFCKQELEAEIVKVTKCVGFEQNDLIKKSKELSGGMKRRLSLAMALIGDSKVHLKNINS